VIIRPIATKETSLVSEMCVAAYVAGDHLKEGDAYTATLRGVGSRVEYTLVATIDGEIVGTICHCPPDGLSPAALAGPDEYKFRFLAIAPGAWGAGVGSALVANCEAQAIASGARYMLLSVIDSNERAINLYERLGYVRLPEREWSPTPAGDSTSGTSIRLLVMRKELPLLGTL
jgi:ribosomal protein S18 acetylase RimI-like enzyme